MRRILHLACLLAAPYMLFAQSGQNNTYHMCSDSTAFNVPFGALFDSGGDSLDYSNGEDCWFTIANDSDSLCLTLTVSYDLEVNYDYLYLGTDTSATYTLNGQGFNLTYSFSPGSDVQVHFVSDNSVTNSGFSIFWSYTSCQTGGGGGNNPPDTTVVTNTTILPAPTVSQLFDAFNTTNAPVTNVTLNCDAAAHGIFQAPESAFGMTGGIVLSTGNAADAALANLSGSTSTNINTPGDADLDSILNAPGSLPTQTFDACVLEFDLYALIDSFAFDYVFASEEYQEFVNSNFNDAFGFFISGPGISGNQNLAVLEDNITPVSINTVNHLAPLDPTTGALVYTDVPFGSGDMTFDGRTTKLTVHPLQPLTIGETYHIKIAIADAGDHIYDSGVFISDLRIGDSVLVAPVVNETIIQACYGETVLVDGVPYSVDENNDNWVFADTLAGGSYTGGDSISVTIIVPLAPAYDDVLLMGCYDEVISYNGVDYSVGNPLGIDTLVAAAANGCDSIVYVNFASMSEPIVVSVEQQQYGTDSVVVTASGSPVDSLNSYTYAWPDSSAGSSVTLYQSGTYALTVTDAYGCTMLIPFVVDLTASSTTPIVGLEYLQIFPNPASDQLSVQLGLLRDTDLTLDFYNVLGQSLYHRPLSGSVITHDIDVAHLPAGTYFLHLRSGAGSEVRKVIVE